MAKLTARIGLLLAEKTDGQYYHVILRPVVIGPTAEERAWFDQTIERYPNQTLPLGDTIRNPRAEDGRLDLADLEIYSQGETTANPRRLYAWECRFRDVFSIDLRRAQRIEKTLTAIDRHFTKTAAKYGHPESYGAFVARAAEAIGADAIVIADSNRGWSYADNDHRILSIESGVYAINAMIAKWMRPEPVEASA